MSLLLENMAVPLRTDSDGVVRVGGSRVTLDTIVAAYDEGATAEQIAQQYPAVSLGDVYATIAYYLAHTAAVRGYLGDREKLAALVRGEIAAHRDLSGIGDRLVARRNKHS